MEKNLLSKMVLVKNDEFVEDKKFEDTEASQEPTEEPTEEGEGKEEEETPTEEGDKKFVDTTGEKGDTPEDAPEVVESEGLPAQDIIKVLHEHNKWEIDEEALAKYENSEEGLMEFFGDMVQANIPAPAYGSDEVAEFDEYVKNGGDPSKFLETYYSNGNFNYEEADIEDEDIQKKVYTDYLKKTTKFSDAKIAKEVQTKLDLDELGEEVKEAKEYMIEFDKTSKENLKVQLEKDKQAQQEQYEQYLDAQKKAIIDAKEIAGFEVTDKLAKELFEFGFERGKDGRTGYERLKEEDTQLDLKLLMLAMKGVDKATIAKEAVSKASKELKKNLSRYTDSAAKSTTNTAPTEGKSKKDGNLKKWII